MLFAAAALSDWAQNQGLRHQGLLVKRPFHGKWDSLQSEIDSAINTRFSTRFGPEPSLHKRVLNDGRSSLTTQLPACVDEMLATASLPAPLSKQIRADALSIGKTLAFICPSARALDVKLEVFGEVTCSRWHRDHYVGRAIVSYTGITGTEYTSEENVDLDKLRRFNQRFAEEMASSSDDPVDIGNEGIIKEPDKVKSVEVGDILLMKGTHLHRQIAPRTDVFLPVWLATDRPR